MRRRKSGLGLVKVLSATAAAAVFATGGVSVYAAEGYTKIQIGSGAGARVIDVADLLTNDDYAQAVINTFNVGGVMYAVDENGVGVEFSQTARAENGVFNSSDDGDLAYVPYFEN